MSNKYMNQYRDQDIEHNKQVNNYDLGEYSHYPTKIFLQILIM